MTYKPPYIPNYAFQINSTLDRGSQNIRLLLLQAQAEGRDFSGMSLNLDNIYIEGGGLSEFKDQFGNTIKRSRDKFGRFTSNTGAAIKKGAERALETNKEALIGEMRKSAKQREKSYLEDTRDSFDLYDKIRDDILPIMEKYENKTKGGYKGDFRIGALKQHLTSQYKAFGDGEITKEKYVESVTKDFEEILNIVSEINEMDTPVDKAKLAIRAVPGQVEKGMNALLKSPEKAIASADAAYKSASKEVKSAIDATVSSGLDLLQKSKKDICNKIGATGKAAQDAFSSVVKAAQNKGKGVKERIESAKKKTAEIMDSGKELTKKAAKAALTVAAYTVQIGGSLAADAAVTTAIVAPIVAIDTAIGITPPYFLLFAISQLIVGIGAFGAANEAIYDKFTSKVLGKVKDSEKENNQDSKVAASRYISSSADSYLDYLIYS